MINNENNLSPSEEYECMTTQERMDMSITQYQPQRKAPLISREELDKIINTEEVFRKVENFKQRIRETAQEDEAR